MKYLVVMSALLLLLTVLGRIFKRKPKPRPRELVVVPYEQGDRLLRLDEGWRLAPEEDSNLRPGMVCLERDI